MRWSVSWLGLFGWSWYFVLWGALLFCNGCGWVATEEPAVVASVSCPMMETDTSSAGAAEVPAPWSGQKLVPVHLELPAPAFRGTPVPCGVPFVEEPVGEPRPPFLAPAGTENLARGKRVTSSDLSPRQGQLDYVTNGQKEASEFGILELGPGTQWIQIDLGQTSTLFALLVWHQHAEARVYRDVVIQISDDPDFLESTTVFNNDQDHTSGLGIGTDWGYVETAEGRLIDCRGVEGRYVRLSSRGNHLDEFNHYTEVEVYGLPAVTE